MSNTPRLPPIQYLTAFVASARHCSFKLAAGDLNVSPSAVSQQIKTLESHVGLSLFSRKARELRLTKAGESFYQIAEKTIKSYETGFAHFVEQNFSSSIKVSMIPYVANEVVIPQLHHFHENYPDLNLIVESSTHVESLEPGKLDAAIRFGVPPWGDNNIDLISNVKTNLVAAKGYFDKNPIKTRSDFQKQTLIHIRTQVNDWQRFMDNMTYPFKPKKELFFDSYDAAIRAAEEGLGIAIGVFPISNNKIREGRLSLLTDQFFSVEEAFYLVTPPNAYKRESYQILLSWLIDIFEDNKL
jgi:LysR family glycine cleavage system transcriptional activator